MKTSSVPPSRGTQVRASRQEDLRRVAEVAAEAWGHAYGGLLSQAAIDDALANWYSPPAMTRRLQAGGLDVAEHERRVIGFVQHASINPNVHEVFALYVLPKFLGKGAGWTMWQHVNEVANRHGSSSIELWVLEGNQLGIQWYDRQGGTVVGERRVDFLDGSHVELRYRFATGK